MRKIACILAALTTIAVAAPTVASAEGFQLPRRQRPRLLLSRP